MRFEEWKYYNHAAIPRKSPLSNLNLSDIENGNIWKMDGSPLLARWTTDFDCGYETNWWYVIKDEPFDIQKLQAKKRYEVNKGRKYFEIKIIDPNGFKEELFEIHKSAVMTYPQKNQPTIHKESFIKDIENWKDTIIFGAFFKDTNKLVGYAMLTQEDERFLNFNVLKVIPDYEKYAINAAMVDGILTNYYEFLENKGIICDGARSISHETRFQDYLEKYFQFRKAYCILHVEYSPKIKWIVKIIYPFRKILLKFDSFKLVHNINSILKMEEFIRGNYAR